MFSVIIPLYNKELSILNTIQSVLVQTYQKFEIVVIDDGSTDNSPELVKKLKDPRIRLIQQENQGVSAARNIGIKHANYDWIAFLDGDDLWKPNHLEEILKMMDKFPNEKIYVTSFEYSDNRKLYKHNRTDSIFRIDNYFEEAIKEILIWTSIIVIHKSCFNIIGNFNINLSRGEDLDLWERLARRFDIIKSITVTAIYRIEAENRSFEVSSFDIRKSAIYYYDLNNLTKDELKYYKNKLIRACRTFITRKDLKNFFILYTKYYPHISLLKVLKLRN